MQGMVILKVWNVLDYTGTLITKLSYLQADIIWLTQKEEEQHAYNYVLSLNLMEKQTADNEKFYRNLKHLLPQ